jgi:ABC-type nitrate/sulfonate/bicarbonate transport system substrate-binding protein
VNTRATRTLWAAIAVVAVLAAGCGDDDEGDGGDGSTGGEGALAEVCPNPVVIQTDWNAQSEHGAAYELLGDDYEIDVDRGAVRGPLVDATGAETGVDVEIRIGGAAIGFQTVTSQLHQDPDILVGFVSTGESVLNADELPTVAVLAPLEKNPQILMWNPEEFPGVETVDQMPEGTLVVGYGPATYLEWMVSAGLITEDQIDGSYDASPSRFVAENGAYMQQGFATSEPYIYEVEVEEWGRPVAYQLVHDMGYELYSQALGVTPETLAAERDCLAAFVPIYQAAQIAYVTDPAATNAVILDMVDTIDNGWVYSEGVTAFSVQAQLDLGVVGNGPDDTLGNFDLERVQGVIDALRPVSEGQGTPLRDDLAPEDVVTNEFVDPSLGLP